MPPGSLWLIVTVIGVAALGLVMGWAFWRSRQASKDRTPQEAAHRDAVTREAFDKEGADRRD